MFAKWKKSLMVAVFLSLGTAACGPEGVEQEAAGVEQAAGEVVLNEFTVDEHGQVKQETTAVDAGSCWNGGNCTATAGYFDELYLSAGRARGWACNRYYPNTYFTIIIQKYIPDYYGNWAWRNVGSGSANVYRADVAQACGGNASHSFDFYGVNTAAGGSTGGSYRMVASASGMATIVRSPTYIR